MGLKARVALIGSLLALILVVSQASGILKATYHTVRPYADRATEILVSGWQYDRTRSELRDVNERIRRFEERKKILAIPTRKDPRGKSLHKDDLYELDKLYRDQRKLQQILNQRTNITLCNIFLTFCFLLTYKRINNTLC